MFPIYPYINVNDLNLDYLLKSIKEIQTQVEYFVSLNAIKYADPIQWDITRQYEKNTIVIDPQTGTAYISVAPVPIGAQLTRPEYWTVVFDLGSFVVRASKNFAINYEADTTTTATFNTPKGGWLVWGDVLYIANVPITAGDSYVEGGNISHFTMEEIIGHLSDLLTTDKDSIVDAINELYTALNNAVNALSLMIGDLNDLTTIDKTSIVNAINELVTNVGNVVISIGDLADLTTTDKSSIVNSINEVVTNLGTLLNVIGDLNDLITTDKTSIVNAINEVKSDFIAEDLKVGDLADLTTTDKSSIVNAINDISSIIPTGMYVMPEDFGAVGDDVNDDYTAIMDAINECISTKKALYFSNKVYHIGTAININSLDFDIYSDYSGYLHYTGSGSAMIIGNAVNRKIQIAIAGEYLNDNTSSCLEVNGATSCTFDCSFSNGLYGLNLNATSGIQFNIFNIGSIINCMECIRLNSSTGWVNDNLFMGGRLTKFSPFPNVCGIHFESTRAFNNNVFIKTSVEGCAKGIWIERSGKNKFEAIRFEGSTTPIQLDANANSNYIEIGYADSQTGTPIDNGTYNTIILGYTQLKNDYLLFESDDPRKCAYNYPGGECEPLPFMVGLSNDTETSGVINNGTSGEYWLWFNNDIKYFKFNTGNAAGTRLKFYVNVYNEANFTFCIMFKDSNGNIIHSVKSFPDLVESVINTNTMFHRTLGQGNPIYVYIPNTAVLMYVGVYSANNSNLVKLRIYNDEDNKTIIPVQSSDIGISMQPNKSLYVHTGDYVKNLDYTNNPDVKGWIYDGTQWLEDKLAQ